jgi:hypothetical protein
MFVRRHGLVSCIVRCPYSTFGGGSVDLRDHKGGGLEGNIYGVAELKRLDSFGAEAGQEQGLQPFTKWDVTVLKDCARSYREQFPAAVTLVSTCRSTEPL